MIESEREIIKDKIFNENVNEENYSIKTFIRVGSKNKVFKKVDFHHSYFDNCYFRNCVFDSCNFNGAKFNSSILTGSSFDGCKFDYATFDRTFVDREIIQTGCPGWENVKLKFARTLRTNFDSIGDTEGANDAILIELEATKCHYKKAWKSNESYYRKKYKGWDRAKMFFKWLRFIVLEFIWGNGESLGKLVRSVILLWLIMTIYEVIWIRDDPFSLKYYLNTFRKMPQIFLSIATPSEYSDFYKSLIYALRLIAFGLFISVLIKRYNRR